MSDEAPPRSSKKTHGPRRDRGGGSAPASLQSRAHFLENWDWASVTAVNRGLCARGGAQHGANQEAFKAVEEEWERWRRSELSLSEVFDLLQRCHRWAPFLFFNGNTFAELGRTLAIAVYADLPTGRRREAASAIAHFITGTVERDAMESVIREMERAAEFVPGDCVKSLRGSMRGVITRILDDGRVAVRPASGGRELISLPESLSHDDKPDSPT